LTVDITWNSLMKMKFINDMMYVQI